MSALSFLRECVPSQYFSEIDNSNSLRQALRNLAIWQEDSEVHSEKIYRGLRDIPQSMDLYGDRTALRDQITLIKKGLLISGSFWITLQQGQTHFAKYFDSSAFGIMRAQLISAAHTSGDYLG